MSTQQNSQVKPFCKVCHDAGKSVAEYTSHFVRSVPGPKGKVICPTLLSQGCTYCHKNGHTVKFCSELKKRNKQFNRNQRRNDYTNIKTKTEVKSLKKAAGFAVLDIESDEEDKKEKDSFPQLCSPTAEKKALPESSSYASMAAKPKVDMVSMSVIAVADEASQSMVQKKEYNAKSWADWSDSEDEIEEDDDW
jgi:hypothetical protein